LNFLYDESVLGSLIKYRTINEYDTGITYKESRICLRVKGSTGTHLHFEVRVINEDGTYNQVDPMLFDYNYLDWSEIKE